MEKVNSKIYIEEQSVNNSEDTTKKNKVRNKPLEREAYFKITVINSVFRSRVRTVKQSKGRRNGPTNPLCGNLI